MWDTHTNVLHLDLAEGETMAEGVYSLSIDKYNSSIHMISSLWSSQQLLPPWVGSHVTKNPVDATKISSVAVFWMLDDVGVDKVVDKEVVAQVEFANNESIAIPLTDDGLLSPDLVVGDFLFSGSFYALTSTGWYSPLLTTALPSNLTETSLKPTRTVAGQAFYVQKPLIEPPPPSR